MTIRALGIKERGSLGGWGNVGPGGGREPHRAVQTVRKGRERQALGSTVVQSN